MTGVNCFQDQFIFLIFNTSIKYSCMNMYFVAIVLPDPLNEKVLHWKKYMQERYRCTVGLKSPAHITIIPPFWMEENMEEEFLIDVDNFSRSQRSFPVATNNFSCFKPRTIFIAVEENKDLERLKIEADVFFSDEKHYEIKAEKRSFHPHITIATRDLLKKDFYESWPVFEKETFKEQWTADGISVLKHNKKNWEVIHTASFEKKPDDTIDTTEISGTDDLS